MLNSGNGTSTTCGDAMANGVDAEKQCLVKFPNVPETDPKKGLHGQDDAGPGGPRRL